MSDHQLRVVGSGPGFARCPIRAGDHGPAFSQHGGTENRMERMPSWPLEGQRVDVGTHRSGVPGFPLSRGVVHAAPPSDGPRYVAAIARRKWFVILITLLGTAAGVVA